MRMIVLGFIGCLSQQVPLWSFVGAAHPPWSVPAGPMFSTRNFDTAGRATSDFCACSGRAAFAGGSGAGALEAVQVNQVADEAQAKRNAVGQQVQARLAARGLLGHLADALGSDP